MEKISIGKLQEIADGGGRITMMTAYDYPMAVLMAEAGIDLLLVGDSGGMCQLGYETTVPVTMEEMLMMCKAVVRGAGGGPFIVADMPFMSYHVSVEQAVENAGRLIKEGGADCVKLEGGVEMAERIAAIVAMGMPVMGHIGLTPQTATALGGFKVQGKSEQVARDILADAHAVERAGCFAMVIEAVPALLARTVTERLAIPVVGIGAGADCNGQCMVTHDALGFFDRFTPKFAKQFVNLRETALEGISAYRDEVRAGTFPEKKHSFTMSKDVLETVLRDFDDDEG